MLTLSENCPVTHPCICNGKGTVDVKHLSDQATLFNHGTLFAHVTIDPGHSIGYHEHIHEVEFYYILSGVGIFNDNGVEKVVRSGDCCTTANESHSLENRSSAPLELIALVIQE